MVISKVDVPLAKKDRRLDTNDRISFDMFLIKLFPIPHVED